LNSRLRASSTASPQRLAPLNKKAASPSARPGRLIIGQGNSVEKEQDGDTQPTGPGDIQPTDPALNGREGPPSPSASVASSSIGASRGYLVHILIAGSPG
jgi:hypothetical protein